MASNWSQATRNYVQRVIEALVCPKCGASNRPGATIVEYDPSLEQAVCGVCAHGWTVEPHEVAAR